MNGNYLIIILIETLIMFFVAFLVGYISKKYSKNKLTLDKATKISLIITIVSMFVIMFVITYMMTDTPNSNSTYQAINIIVILVAFGVILLLYNNGHKKAEIRNANNQIDQLNEYLQNIETMNLNMRTFKHDYRNVLTSMNGYLMEEDIDGLKSYMSEHILPYEASIDSNMKALNNLAYLQNLELKGLLSFKLSQAIEQGIQVKIAIYEDVSITYLGVIDLCRVVGILIDNAIEAAGLSPQKEVNFIVTNTTDSLIIAIENTFPGEISSASKLFEPGYTTKENHSGIGLISVRKLLDQYDLMLETSIESPYFSQVLCLPTDDN